ncbi:MAG: pirin family protein [Gammaproteobacteria bacterium]|nr:pirin family protein [Gammaproteobacteria bacterium]
MQTKIRQLIRTISGIESSDGDGVKLTRVIGSHELPLLDPFLMLDAFRSDNANDYIGGFPSHPHRGFEAVTYLLAGRLRHKDSEGHEGVIEPGGVQWMTAGSGIIHSEMPEQQNGLLHGFQLWINLPAEDKFTPPRYQEFSSDDIILDESDNRTIRVIAGKTDQNIAGTVQAEFVQPMLFDVSLSQGQAFRQAVSEFDNTFIYVIEGELAFTNPVGALQANQLGIVVEGNVVEVMAKDDVRFLFASAQPLNEPIARGGPFVMTTQQQLQQAFRDYAR